MIAIFSFLIMFVSAMLLLIGLYFKLRKLTIFSSLMIALFGALFIKTRPDALSDVVFAGRISQSSKHKWLNNRLVVSYLQNAEVGRARSQLSDFRNDVPSPTDGVFSIQVSNPYRLRETDITICKSKGTSPAGNLLYCWLGEFPEDSSGIELNVKDKRITYSIRLFPGDYDSLPEEMKESGASSLIDGNIVILSSGYKSAPSGLLNRIYSFFGKASEAAASMVVKNVEYNPDIEVVDLPSHASTTTVNNCRGSAPISQTFTDSKTFVKEYHLEAALGLGAAIPLDVVELKLGAQGGYRQKQIITKTTKFEMPAAPGENVSYEVRWKERWQRGIAVINGTRGDIRIPFKLRKDVESILETKPLACT